MSATFVLTFNRFVFSSSAFESCLDHTGNTLAAYSILHFIGWYWFTNRNLTQAELAHKFNFKLLRSLKFYNMSHLNTVYRIDLVYVTCEPHSCFSNFSVLRVSACSCSTCNVAILAQGCYLMSALCSYFKTAYVFRWTTVGNFRLLSAMRWLCLYDLR